MSDLVIKGLCKKYGDVDAVQDVDLKISDQEFVVLVGPSGCGKSTLLRMIAGLEDITAGELFIDNELMNDIPPSRRGLAMVFQSYALYPHMTVRQNMSVGLKIAGEKKDIINQKVETVATTLQLTELLDRLPKQLSGGQRQRVAIGRSIVRKPKILLFDEPLSNLDAALRLQMRLELVRLRKELDATIVYVTHDQVEAMTLADRIVAMREGKIEQVGTPLELYNKPANRFVASFIGSPNMNFLDAKVQSVTGEGATLIISSGETISDVALSDVKIGDALTLGIRPEDVTELDGNDELIPLKGTIDVIEKLGATSFAYVSMEDGTPFTVSLNRMSETTPNSHIDFGFRREHMHIFSEKIGRLEFAN